MITIHVCPKAGDAVRVFRLQEDQYGASLTDMESGLAVTLDWNGEEVKAFVTAEGQDEPTHMHVMRVIKPKKKGNKNQ